MLKENIGFIGLGNIGQPMANKIVTAGFNLTVFDIAGTEARAPAGALPAESSGSIASTASVLLLCIPSVNALTAIIKEITDVETTKDLIVVNTSTVGPTAAVSAAAELKKKNIPYVDAPVSGGVFRAKTGELSTMFSGDPALLERVRPVLETYSSNIFNIGIKAGEGQRMKLVNNCLNISAFVLASEALAYGQKGGLDLKTMLDVVNVSTGQTFVTEHIFTRYVLSESYNSAGTTPICRKDLSLFVGEAKIEGRSHDLAKSALNIVEALDDSKPDTDYTEIYPFVRDSS